MGGGGGGGGEIKRQMGLPLADNYAKSILCIFLQDFQQLVSDMCRPFFFGVAYYNNT